MRAAASVLTKSDAMVIGPTPPGTGVMASAFSDTLVEVHISLPSGSPAWRVASSTRLMPTSMTTAPSLTMSAVIAFGCPMAATRMSALSVCADKSTVLVWQTVTVALAPRLPLHQQRRQGLAYYLAAAANHHVPPGGVVPVPYQQLLNAQRACRARRRRGPCNS